MKVLAWVFFGLPAWDIANSTFEGGCLSLLLGLVKFMLAVKAVFSMVIFLVNVELAQMIHSVSCFDATLLIHIS